MKQQWVFLLCSLPLASMAQHEETGIQWTSGLSWKQVQEKARQENKYIFLDVYTTWCGPCKKMDKEVYVLDSIGQYYKDRFVAVKVQMDQTAKDDQQVKAWRGDAQAIAQQYRIKEYPSFLFFSPNGTLVDKKTGYATPSRFMAMSRKALTPGLVYTDPMARYERLMASYRSGKKEYDSLYYMFKTAKHQGDAENAQLLSKDLDGYLESLPAGQLYTKDRLAYMSSVTVYPSSKWFGIFYRNAEKVNKTMGDNNYAQRIVDKVIMDSIAYSFVHMPPPGMIMFSGKRVPADTTEADWKGLEQKIRRQFNAYYAQRVTLATKFTWYKQHWNLPAFAHSYFSFIDHYGIDSHDWTSKEWINNVSYLDIFVAINDATILDKAIDCMQNVVEKRPSSHILDTYASLLYKAGRQQEAIEWEEKALQKAKTKESTAVNIPTFQSTLEKMKQGQKLDWLD